MESYKSVRRMKTILWIMGILSVGFGLYVTFLNAAFFIFIVCGIGLIGIAIAMKLLLEVAEKIQGQVEKQEESPEENADASAGEPVADKPIGKM